MLLLILTHWAQSGFGSGVFVFHTCDLRPENHRVPHGRLQQSFPDGPERSSSSSSSFHDAFRAVSEFDSGSTGKHELVIFLMVCGSEPRSNVNVSVVLVAVSGSDDLNTELTSNQTLFIRRLQFTSCNTKCLPTIKSSKISSAGTKIQDVYNCHSLH